MQNKAKNTLKKHLGGKDAQRASNETGPIVLQTSQIKMPTAWGALFQKRHISQYFATHMSIYCQARQAAPLIGTWRRRAKKNNATSPMPVLPSMPYRLR